MTTIYFIYYCIIIITTLKLLIFNGSRDKVNLDLYIYINLDSPYLLNSNICLGLYNKYYINIQQ